MIVYSSTKQNFIEDVASGRYAKIVEKAVQDKLHHRTGASERRSWQNSLYRMRGVISGDEIPNDAGVAVEYNIPSTSKRVDFIITGYDHDNKMEAVFIELKQWESAEKAEGQELVKTVLGGALIPTSHPSYQVWSYTKLLENLNINIQERGIKLNPCVYLHNYCVVDRETDAVLDEKKFGFVLKKAPVFTIYDENNLKDYIKKHIKYGDKLCTLETIDESALRPSKSLQDCLPAMLKGKPEFILIDEQKVVFEEIMACARLSDKDGKKRTIIVKGGPGTGKTVVAINLLVEAIKEKIYATYVTKNSAPREVFFQKLTGSDYTKKYLRGLFCSSGSFTTTTSNVYGILLCDEAHRLKEKSGMFNNQGESQIKEIIHSSKTSVFFIDEEQRVTSKDVGSVMEIEKWAQKEKSSLIITELLSQFRCNGSDGYLSWIDNTLQIRETANITLEDIPYDFQIFEDPQKLREAIIEKNKQDNKSRMTAGYCWEWKTKKQKDLYDIVIDNFEMKWNLNTGKKPFAIDENSINQVGCIHTTQGLEFNYVGVIIGDDLRYDGEKVITDFTKRAKSDKSLSGLIGKARKGDKVALKQCDGIIRNTYRTLMTRGMNGCYIYCTDKKLAEHFRASIL